MDYNSAAPTIEDEESDEDFGKFESKGESLLTLVQPELSSLADNWLAALRDHALLMLPPGMMETCFSLIQVFDVHVLPFVLRRIFQSIAS